MNVEDARRKVAEIIYRVLDEGAEDNQVYEIIRQYPEFTSKELHKLNDKSLWRGFHALDHYAVDSDIRRKDKAYADIQINALKDIAKQLSQGLPLTENHGYW